MFNTSRKKNTSPFAVLAQQQKHDQGNLVQHVGWLGQRSLDRSQRQRMVSVLDRLNQDRADTALSVGQLSGDLAGQKLSAGLVVSQLPDIAALTHTLGTQLSVFNQKSTEAVFGEIRAHVGVRHRGRQVAEDLHVDGQISADERALVDKLGDEMLQGDFQRVVNRTEAAKDALDSMAQRAIAFISNKQQNSGR